MMSETLYNAICDTQALHGASPGGARCLGPVVALARGCLARAGHGL